MSKTLPKNHTLGDHHMAPYKPSYVNLFHIGLIAIVAFAVWGFLLELLPMD